jgi:hypothetical protein
MPPENRGRVFDRLSIRPEFYWQLTLDNISVIRLHTDKNVVGRCCLFFFSIFPHADRIAAWSVEHHRIYNGNGDVIRMMRSSNRQAMFYSRTMSRQNSLVGRE